MKKVLIHVSGLVNTGYLLAKAKYLSNDLANAEILLKLCLDKEETIAEAYLLMAQVKINFLIFFIEKNIEYREYCYSAETF